MPLVPIPVPPGLWERLFERGTDRVVDYMVDNVPAAVGAAIRALKGAVASNDRGEAEKAAAAVSQAVAGSRELLDVLTNPPLPEPDGNAPVIEVFRDFLDYEMKLIGQLSRPVALPGFFNGSRCLVVIDVRKLIGEGVEPIRCRHTAAGAVKEITFRLGDTPRIWLVPTDPDHRDEDVDRLNAAFDTESYPPLELTNVMNTGTGGTPGQMVTAITDRRVDVTNRTEDSVWYEVTNDTEGIELFRRKLAGMVAAFFGAEQKRRDAWSSATAPDPSEPAV